MSAEQRVLVHLNLGGNELRNVVLESLSGHPATATEGRIYWNSSWHAPVFYDGTQWQVIPTASWVQGELEVLGDDINAVSANLYNTTQDLLAAIAAEEARATAAESAAVSEIWAEAAAREAADANLQTFIETVDLRVSEEVDALTALITAETTRATAAETGLASDIADVAAAVSALDGDYATDAALQSAVSSLESSIAAEAASRTAADGTLTSDLAAETSARQAADASLASDLATESTARTAADSELQTAIAAEAATRAAADTEIGTHIQNLYGSQNGVIFPALQSIDTALQGHEGRLDTIESDYATKAYVDAAIQGLDIVESVKVTSSDYTGSGLEVDGVTLAEGNRVLINNGDPTDGIYLVSSGAWTQSADDADVGTFVFVEGGNHAGTGWVLTEADGWVQFSGAGTLNSGLGLNLDGTIFNVITGPGIVIDESNAVAVDRSVVPFKFAANLGDGSTTEFTVPHSLGTPDVTVSVRDANTGEMVLCSVTVVGNNDITVTFATAPSTDAFRVVVIG